jgi:hypothetical protein
MCRMSKLTLKAVLAFCLLVNISGLAKPMRQPAKNVSSRNRPAGSIQDTRIADEIRLKLATTGKCIYRAKMTRQLQLTRPSLILLQMYLPL